MTTQEKLTLSELNGLIRETVENHFQHPYWVIAEISEMKINASGHCYLELIEKGPDNDLPLAKARATIWAYTFRLLKPYFETTAGRPLTTGIKVLLQVVVSFHEVYGLSLTIKDIDPGFTIGEMALKRKKIIERLRKEGIFDMNRQLPFPLVPQRIAIISSETAAGYQDFVHQLTHNPQGYSFDLVLFPAVMQGKDAEDTLIRALEKIYSREQNFDLVVIIRGGGSQADLGCFDNYRLSAHMAQLPLPILTGIGHEKDETVADLVAYTNLKTPTAVAAFILDRMMTFEERIHEVSEAIYQRIQDILFRQNNLLEHNVYKIKSLLQKQLGIHTHLLDRIRQKLFYLSENNRHEKKNERTQYVRELIRSIHDYIEWHKQKPEKYSGEITNVARRYLLEKKQYLDVSQKSLSYLDPMNILRRGYSITRLQGHAIKDPATVKTGDVIHTKLLAGDIKSRIIK